MAHDRKLVLGAVALVKARLRGDAQILSEVRDEIEPLLIDSGYFNGAPFKWVGLIIRYGLENRTTPEYQRINKTHGDLPVAIELDMRELRAASHDELKNTFRRATLAALLDVARKFNRPPGKLEEQLERLRESTPAVRPQ